MPGKHEAEEPHFGVARKASHVRGVAAMARRVSHQAKGRAECF